jgi:nitroreductase
LIEDCSAAIQNMLLAVHSLGLGAVWCGLYPVIHLTRGIKQLLSLPDTIIPVGLVSIGHKGEERTAADRFDENKIHYEMWGSKKAAEAGL